MKIIEDLRTLISIGMVIYAGYILFDHSLPAYLLIALAVTVFPFPKSKAGRIIRILITFSLVCADIAIYAGLIKDPLIRPNIREGEIRVHFIDVGQGDCQFIELPDGKSILIDSGVNEYGPAVVRYIKDQGYRKIDILIATHPHADHIGSMHTVVDELDIGSFYTVKLKQEQIPDSYSVTSLNRSLSKKKIKTQYAQRGDILYTDEDNGIVFSCLSPADGLYFDDLNQYSLITSLQYEHTRVIFTGDAGFQAENQITGKGDLSTTVLKLGHHGSGDATGFRFLQETDPDIAVIQVGENDFEDPNVNLLTRLEERGTDVYRTDLEGTIIITMNNYEILSVETEKE